MLITLYFITSYTTHVNQISSSRSDLLRQLASGGLGVLRHRVPLRRQEQRPHHRRDSGRRLPGLAGDAGPAVPHPFHRPVGPDVGEGHGDRHHLQGHRRLPDRCLRERCLQVFVQFLL